MRKEVQVTDRDASCAARGGRRCRHIDIRDRVRGDRRAAAAASGGRAAEGCGKHRTKIAPPIGDETCVAELGLLSATDMPTDSPPVKQHRAGAIEDREPLGVSLSVDYDGAKSSTCVFAD
jgi:hypothetical protein